ncbi:catalase [Actinoplanes sp. SE50]|uniref:catalase n=1 Tax=unclassified Actinoplanes TaxID=2626549 RepID=UPI00023EBEFF|nr:MULTISPECIES: catalase [unclassified Actinoplanes]AEV84034.1 catalase [Actinoplanes sp. SE50/110]ATO82427.1 catalase [Actinoplanes sp. SE50]SLL99834.1 catalase HPII [Actinoplanes sp. SE50/110]
MEARSPAEVIKDAVTAVTSEKKPDVPGAPGSGTPTVEEPATPREPLPPKPEQGQPDTRTPTGAPTGAPPTAYGQQGPYLTTAQGARLRDTDHSLKAGPRGPILLQDHHFREKITHFDHERIPERVVHARGAGAHGVFTSYGTAAALTQAGFLKEKGKQTDVFVRFSTVLGSRGSADTVRDTRGFATKFYTDEGTFDLVGNNMPVFFIQDAIKFPDIVHAAKWHPDREIPQAQSAHDTFWDFVSLHTEAQHHTMWNMSDRGIPRSYRTMEGFGVHTFRLVNDAGETVLVKFHWKPKLGVHSLVWEEAQITNGVDPDFHRRDLYDSIEAGAYPEWELGLQVFPDNPEETFAGIDLLDPTKIVPEELAPVQPVGKLVLNRTPTNFHAEVEQVAFHLGNLVPGIDVTNDPLLQGRLFSYLDTQLTRLAGPNFHQIPINAPHAPVNDMLRDGFHQHAVHAGVAPYRPNSLDGGNPFTTTEGSFVDVPVVVTEAPKIRDLPVSFKDHYTQVRLFWQSMTPVEREHIIRAYTFELGKCYHQAIKERQLQCLANIDPVLCEQVALGLGLPAPAPSIDLPEVTPSAALSQIGQQWPADGRIVGIVVDETGGDAAVAEIREAIAAAGMVPLIIAPHGGKVGGLTVQRTFATARSIEYDAVLVAAAPVPAPDAVPARDEKAGAPRTAAVDPRVNMLVDEAWRHAKAIGGWGTGADLLRRTGLADTPGVVVGDSATEVLTALQQLMANHRVWERFPATVA